MDWEIPLTEYFQTKPGKNAGNHAGQQNRNKCCAGGYLRCYFKLRFVKFHSVIRPSKALLLFPVAEESVLWLVRAVQFMPGG